MRETPGSLHSEKRHVLSWFTSGDIDGFFGLFFSGFPDLLLIVGLSAVCGFSPEFVAVRILPGVALSVFAGNLFYGWQARKLAARTNRDDVTAIPFGINTPTIFAYVFLIMAPIYRRTHSGMEAWEAGVFASFVSGLVQTGGAFCTDWLRRHTPRAALLCPLAGLALAYLCLGFIFGVFEKGAIALFPMVVLFVLYASRLRIPFRIPPALIAIGLGAVLVAVLRHMLIYAPPAAPPGIVGLHLPVPVNFLALFGRREWLSYLSVILPLAALDTLASLQILESVKVAGDDYRTTPSLLMNGLGTLIAAVLGSPFPTTLYVGHAAHKANGARSGYSILNGLVTLVLCLTGLLPLVLRVIPLEVAGPVIVWFGLVTVGQAFIEVPRTQVIAVVLGLVPMLAQWASSIADTVIRSAGSSLANVMPHIGTELALAGLLTLGQGALLTSMIWAAVLALAIERKFFLAAGWMSSAALLSAVGVIHAYRLTDSGIEGNIVWNPVPALTLSYIGGIIFLLLCGWYNARIQNTA